MAFLAYDPNLDPEKKQQEQQNQSISGASTAFDGQPPGSQVGKPKSSGQFTNIQGYLNANKEQANQMGSKLVTNVESNAQQAQNDIQQFANEKQSVSNVDPNKYLSNPATANKTEYQSLRASGGYTGPSNLSQTQNYQNALNSSTKANDLVKASSTEEGRMTMLQDAYKRPNYSRGMQKLDQALLQNDAGSKQKFADINQKYSGISSMFDTAATDVGNSINQAQQTALANKQAILTAEEKAKKDLIDPIQQRVSEANSNNNALIDRVLADASDETLSDETMGLLGMKEGQGLYDLNLASYLTPDRTQIGLDNAATGEERARYSALASLLDDPTMNQITSGGKEIKPVSFNKDQFDKDLASKDTEFKKAYEQGKSNTVLSNQYKPSHWVDNHAWTNVYQNYTPQQLETQILPELKRVAAYREANGQRGPEADIAGWIERSLAGWKDKFKSNRVVKKG